MQKPLWQPTKAHIEQSNMWLFMHYVQDNYNHDIHDYASLYNWSIKQPEQFWPAVFQYCRIDATTPWHSVIEKNTLFYETQWFMGCELNFAKNLLRYCDDPDTRDQPAIIFWGEDKVKRRLTYKQLYRQVTHLAHALKSTGVTKGDRVAGFMPNMPESVIAMLATASIGAIWSSCSPDFGYQSVMDRFGQIEPKVLFIADGYYFKGKKMSSINTAKDVIDAISSIEKLVVVPYLDDKPNISKLKNAVLYEDYLFNASVNATPTLIFQPVPFNHPLYIMYSSGTTGVPKCIVHSTGGTLIQHLKELVLHTDLKQGERIFYFTTCGWMMWNWLISSLATGATVMLYDGNPFHPKPDILIDYIEKEKINVFGTSAKYISALEKAGVKPKTTHNLGHLRTILSTGSPLSPESYDFVYNHIKPDLQLASISGGTDIISCFALGNPMLPIYKGELQCRGLGMDVDVFNESGQSIRAEKGELVCKSPFPSMPVYFWNDKNKEKYQAAYFEKHNHNNQAIWAHGDYAELTFNNGIIIYGRSDAVLNPGGVRIGTAEIYRQVEKLSEVIESLAVGQDWDNDVRIVLFVKLHENIKLDDNLFEKIIQTIKNNTTPRHVPAKVIQIDDIPRTISGKITELAVRNVIHNLPVKNIDALANPEALKLFKDLDELQN